MTRSPGSLVLVLCSLVACDTPPTEAPSEPAPVHSDTPATVPTAPPSSSPSESKVVTGTDADAAPWLSLADYLHERLEAHEWRPDETIVDDASARAWFCSNSHGGPVPCEGMGPWLISVTPDERSWAYLLVDHREGAWHSSAPFGEGGLARCGADTLVELVAGSPRPQVKIDDYYEFEDEECESEDDEGNCEEWETSCGTPFETACTVTFDPATLEEVEVVGECSAYELGQSEGYRD